MTSKKLAHYQRHLGPPIERLRVILLRRRFWRRLLLLCAVGLAAGIAVGLVLGVVFR